MTIEEKKQRIYGTRQMCNMLRRRGCGFDEKLPPNAKIWLEAYLDPTRNWKEIFTEMKFEDGFDDLLR